jgi:hypothetical protein
MGVRKQKTEVRMAAGRVIYSWRSASIGSMRAARLLGIQPESADLPIGWGGAMAHGHNGHEKERIKKGAAAGLDGC